MARLPTPGSDAGNWGDILNDFLTQAHKTDGTLKDDTVGPAQLVDDAVGNAQLANNSVGSAQLTNSAVQTIALVGGAVTTPKLADGSITSAKLAPGVLSGSSTIADGSITSAKLADSAVTNVKVDAVTRTSLTKADSASQPGHTHAIADVANLQTTLDGKQPTGSYVLTSRTVAGHALSSDITITPADIGAATSAQGTKADTAVQPGSLATVATSGAYTDLTGKPTLGNAASLNVGTTTGTVAAGDDARIASSVPSTRTVAAHPLSSNVAITASDIGAATSAQGTKADTAVQPGSLATVATSGAYTDLTGKPTLGNAASLNVGTTTGTVAAGDDVRIVAAVPDTRTVAGKSLSSDVTLTAADVGAATTAQGTLAASAVQAGQIVAQAKLIVGMTYFAVFSRSFPALIRPPEPGRGRLIIRNVGTTNVNVVVAGRTVANYNSPGWTGSISVAAGKELVAHNCTSDLFIGPDADGTTIKVKVYAEVNA